MSGGDAGVGPLNNVTVTGLNSEIRVTFVLEMAVTLTGGSILQVNGAGNPVNETTVNFTDTLSSLRFQNEDWAAFNAEHITKATYNNTPLSFGADPFVAESGDNAIASAFNGAAGVQINALSAIPEPSSLALLALSGIVLLARRVR